MKRAFTVVEMLIVVTIIAILVALLTPSLRGALDAGRMAACGNNLRQIGVAFYAYGSDYRGRLPVTFEYDAGDYDAYRAAWYGADGSALEHLFIGYADYGDFPRRRVSGSRMWMCPAGTLTLRPHSGGGVADGLDYWSNLRNDWALNQGAPFNGYQTAMREMYNKGDESIPPVFESGNRGKARLSYFGSRQPLQFCSARAEELNKRSKQTDGYNQGRSNHERDPEGYTAPRLLLYVDGSVNRLFHIAWTNHYNSKIHNQDAAQLNRARRTTWALRHGDPWTVDGLLPSSYPNDDLKPFHFKVFDP